MEIEHKIKNVVKPVTKFPPAMKSASKQHRIPHCIFFFLLEDFIYINNI